MTTRPKLSDRTVERVNRIARRRADEEAGAAVDSLPHEDRIELVLDEYEELLREVEQLREEVERLRRKRDGGSEGLHGKREKLENLKEEQADPTRGEDTFEF